YFINSLYLLPTKRIFTHQSINKNNIHILLLNQGFYAEILNLDHYHIYKRFVTVRFPIYNVFFFDSKFFIKYLPKKCHTKLRLHIRKVGHKIAFGYNFEATFTITITTAIDVNCSVVFNVNISSNELILDNVSPLWQHINVVYIKVHRGMLKTGASRFNSQFGVIGMMRKINSKFPTTRDNTLKHLYWTAYIPTGVRDQSQTMNPQSNSEKK
ncbi:hypothetical protein AGLY_011368, partial [Aphis glycines]